MGVAYSLVKEQFIQVSQLEFAHSGGNGCEILVLGSRTICLLHLAYVLHTSLIPSSCKRNDVECIHICVACKMILYKNFKEIELSLI